MLATWACGGVLSAIYREIINYSRNMHGETIKSIFCSLHSLLNAKTF